MKEASCGTIRSQPKNRDELSAYAAETKAVSSTTESMKYIKAKISTACDFF